MMTKLKDELERIGLEMGTTTGVPCYECGVQAGLPTDRGCMVSGVMSLPADIVEDGMTFSVKVHGESMIDYDIREGDWLTVRTQCTAECGDIVIARINGACTVKTYFEDEDGEKWLVPGNPDFMPIRLCKDDDNELVGVVMQIVHDRPRTSYRECAQAVKKVKREGNRTVREADIVRALKAAVDVMSARKLPGSRPWFAVYRAFTDRGVVQKGDYAGFVAILDNVMGEEAPSLNVKDMRANLDVQSFEEHVSLWSVDNAPVSNKRFYDYLEVAKVAGRALSGAQY